MSTLMNYLAAAIVVVGILYLILYHAREEINRTPLKYTPESRASRARGDEAEWLDTFQ